MCAKTVLVTGANTGIGYALCKLLATEHGCSVLLGSRTKSKGEKAVADIKKLAPNASVELVEIDVSSDESVAAAAAAVKAKGVTLYGLVNNAGVGLNTSGDIIETNFKGPIRVTEAFLELIQDGGRIVNVSSGGASSWVRQQDEATKKFYSNPDISKEALVADVAKQAAGSEGGWPGTYGLSKAGLTAYTLYQAKAYPHLTCVCEASVCGVPSRRWRKCAAKTLDTRRSLSPGFIQTNMTKGFGAKLTPEEGCVSSLHALFGDVTSGWYYGSDAKRSPLTCCRDPGTSEYEGEENPDPTRYNN